MNISDSDFIGLLKETEKHLRLFFVIIYNYNLR